MPRIIFAILTLVLCSHPAMAGRLPLVVGIDPMKFFTQRIGGDRVDVAVMVPSGADAHVYEPRPSQMKAVAAAAAYLSLGLEFETAWMPRFKAANPALRVVQADAGIEKVPMPSHHHEAEHGGHHHEAEHGGHHHEAEHGGHHHEAGYDPHIWTAPPLVKAIATNIAAALSTLDPDAASFYGNNLAAFHRELDALDAEIRATLADGQGQSRTFMVFHPAWGYFARNYGLDQIAVEMEGKEPGPKQLAHVIDEARKAQVRVIFVQPQTSSRTAEVIARAIGARVTSVDPLAADWEENLRQAARAFRAALR